MTDTPPRRDRRLMALALLGAAVALGALGLSLFGIGAELQQPKTVTLTVLATQLEQDVAAMPAVGDSVFTDPAGMLVGRVSAVKAEPYVQSVPDSVGSLHRAEDPTQWQVTVTISATGRQGDGIVSVGNEVVQAGQNFNVISKQYFLRGTVVGIDVR